MPTVKTLLYVSLLSKILALVTDKSGSMALERDIPALVGIALNLSQVSVGVLVVLGEESLDVTPGSISRDPAPRKPVWQPTADQFRSCSGLYQDISKTCHVFAL